MITQMTVRAAERGAQRDTPPEVMVVMEHVLATCEVLRAGYAAVLAGLKHGVDELAEEWLELVSALQTKLFTWLGRP